jgi:hypothetical protein
MTRALHIAHVGYLPGERIAGLPKLALLGTLRADPRSRGAAEGYSLFRDRHAE